MSRRGARAVWLALAAALSGGCAGLSCRELPVSCNALTLTCYRGTLAERTATARRFGMAGVEALHRDPF